MLLNSSENPAMKLFLLLLGLGGILVGCVHCMAQQLPAKAPADLFYVAPHGDDAWSGKLPEANAVKTDGPFATLTRARDAVRALKAAGGHRGPITVLVRGGTHYLKEPLKLGPEDSGTAEQPVIYCAYPGEEAVLSGGRPITGWRKAPTPAVGAGLVPAQGDAHKGRPYGAREARGEGNLWVADVPEAKQGWNFRQLFVGGERQIRARTPNFDPEHPTTGGWLFVKEPPGPKRGAFGVCLASIHTPGDTFTWKVDVPADGDYALWLYYGAHNEPFGRKDMGGRTTMQADDAPPVPLANLPDTGGWDAFRWSRTATLRLTKGETKYLRWTNVQGGGLNWDAFALSDDPAWTPQGTKLAPPAAGKHMLLVHAETFETMKAKEAQVGRAPAAAENDRFHFGEGDLKPWPRSPEPEIHIFPAWGWVNAILSVDKVDHQDRAVHVKNRNCSQDLRPGNRYFVENVFEALDSPGEWFLDRAEGRLYYWPKEADFEKRGVAAPVLDRLIDIAGDIEGESEGGIEGKKEEQDRLKAGLQTQRFVEHVVFRGFTFRHTEYSLEMASVYTPDDGVVWLRRARHCLIENCRFLGVGGYAVRLSLHSSDNAILGNEVAEGGQGGILLVGYPTESQPRNTLIAGNHIHHCGCIWKHVAGIYVTTGSGNRILHNTIAHVPRYGISIKTFGKGSASHRNLVAFNRILFSNLETNDTGAIETLGRDQEDTGNVIRGNLILDVVGLGTTEKGEFLTPHYTWGIYLDDFSSGTEIVGNLVARTVRGGVHVHLGRNNAIEGNILIDGKDQQLECNGAEFMANNRFVRNLVVTRSGALLRVSRWHDKVFAECDRNLYWATGGDPARAFPKGSLAQWQAAGYDTHSVAADPRFVDPAKDDYRLRPDSPAFQLGFQPIDTTTIGIEGYQRPAGLP